ncbi:similar to Saccharomyces cerevisiae YPR124W CTR1 High-affinity copper transporter of the plasma membrane, mediates nearly all copper uptake under low copper conditions [Maudiozyma saulgeensis]|uniref:Copper transport protein n=1 Tax=Maudiozyma saulgeensis TaxID=1789683 RepID=A0A1X7QXK5_9SACH|nr:similar to Saccharomyces cerevisiae YPR124W CTR1 High-affinity copper transporter of the plasma membrane, mediates nearly all copper uptake under low copper conditions [Kazachstania saulgeensis]
MNMGSSSMAMDMSMPSSSSSSSTSSTMSSMVMSSISSTASMVMSTMSMASSSSITSASSSSMDMSHSHGSSSMDMSNSTSSSSMNMEMEMGMNSYLTRKYKDYPVLFEKLYAKDKKGAFGIFVLILAACFVYKFILFVSWCLEVHWFKKWNKSKKFNKNDLNNDKNIEDYDDERTETEYTETGGQLVALPKLPNLMYDIFAPSWKDMFHDIVRILLIFTSTMLIYMLMLVVMTFVLTYVFAVIIGLTLSEVFFNRCKISTLRRWNIQREIKKAMNCPGAANCKCGRHVQQEQKNSFDSRDSYDPVTKYNEKDSTNESTQDNNNNQNGNKNKCVCEPDIHDQDRQIERSMLESARQQEQSNDMDTNLLPAEKFA